MHDGRKAPAGERGGGTEGSGRGTDSPAGASFRCGDQRDPGWAPSKPCLVPAAPLEPLQRLGRGGDPSCTRPIMQVSGQLPASPHIAFIRFDLAHMCPSARGPSYDSNPQRPIIISATSSESRAGSRSRVASSCGRGWSARCRAPWPSAPGCPGWPTGARGCTGARTATGQRAAATATVVARGRRGHVERLHDVAVGDPLPHTITASRSMRLRSSRTFPRQGSCDRNSTARGVRRFGLKPFSTLARRR